jgi:DNA repair exonuclease SbcCD ATPase subunit
MGGTLTLSILEIILLFFAAILLGITVHFTISSRRNLKSSMTGKDDLNKLRDEWKLRYFNDTELKDKELASLKEQLAEAEENANIYAIEAEEMRKENKKLLADMNSMPKVVPAVAQPEKPDYLEQLSMAQSSLIDHNEKISQLLGNIEAIRDAEEKQRVILKNNEELSLQISGLQMKLADKDKEIIDIRKKEVLTKEMTSMLDNAYSEFNVLQSKMQKLETQANSYKMISMEYEDMKESHRRMSHDFEEQKIKLVNLVADHQQVQAQLMETEEKLRESNFQRQQMQKRVTYLEELNTDLQAVSDANKKLENQLKRIGELESMLNMAAEERDQLIRKVEK